MVLDFGAPWIDQSVTPYRYGVQLLDYQSFIYTQEIRDATKSYLVGYFTCSSPNAHITLAIGTNNSSAQYYLTSGHGQAWADLVNEIEEWIKSPPTWEAKMTAVGGIDIEFQWNTYATTINWVNGYSSANPRPYYNYGTCDSCPYRDHPTWSPIGFGWTLQNAFYVSWGAAAANIIPEIYARDIEPYNASQAYQWQKLKTLYPSLFFSGAITQYDACHDPTNGNGNECTTNFQDNSPSEGWQLFWLALNSDSSSAQYLLPWSTDFSWKIE